MRSSQGERGEAGALRVRGAGERGGGRDVRWCDRHEGRAYLPQHRDSAAPTARPPRLEEHYIKNIHKHCALSQYMII